MGNTTMFQNPCHGSRRSGGALRPCVNSNYCKLTRFWKPSCLAEGILVTRVNSRGEKHNRNSGWSLMQIMTIQCDFLEWHEITLKFHVHICPLFCFRHIVSKFVTLLNHKNRLWKHVYTHTHLLISKPALLRNRFPVLRVLCNASVN